MKEDINDPQLQEMDSVLEVVPTLRGRIFEMVVLVGICLLMVSLIKKVPAYGMYLDNLLGFKMSLLHIKLSYEFLVYPLRAVALLSFFYAVYVFLQQKMTKYKLTDLYLEKTHGVFLRESNTTDLVSIKDQRSTRNILERLLGLEKITIMSADITDPEMTLAGITHSDAQKVKNFLQKYAFRNYTEFRIAREKESIRNRRKRDTSVIDDGDEE